MPHVALPLGLGAYPDATTPPQLGSRAEQYGLAPLAAPGTFPTVGEVVAEIDFTIAAVRALSAGQPIQVTTLPEPSSEPALQRHLAALLQIQRTGRAWLWAWPTSEIVDAIPGATRAGVTLARARLWNPLWGDATRAAADRRAQLVADLQWLRDARTALDGYVRELTGYQPWLQAVVDTFATYLAWFQHHLKEKSEKTAKISMVLEGIALVLNLIPLGITQAIALAVTAVDAGIQVHAFREQLKQVAAAGGRVAAGQVVGALVEALAVARAEVQNLRDEVDFQIQVRGYELSSLDRAPTTDPGAALDAHLPPGPVGGPSRLPLWALAGAAVGLAVLAGGRRG